MPLSAAGELAGGDVVPGQINKWHGGSIELTLSQSVVVARSGRSPASGDGEVAAARPRSPEIRRGSR
jgi:hypothetical protein